MSFATLFNELALKNNSKLKFNNSTRISDILLLKDSVEKSRKCKLLNGIEGIELFNKKNYDFYFRLFNENIDNLFSLKDFHEMLISKVDDFNMRNQNYLFTYLFVGNYWMIR